MRDRQPLKSAVRRLVATARLNDREFDRLQRMIANPGHPRSGRRRLLAGLAAAAVLVLGLLHLPPPVRGPHADVVERIAREVFTNHVRIKALDLETRDFRAIRSHFDRLDFVPRESALLASRALELTGGRYCTLQGELATQLVYTARNGELLTQYQAAYDPAIFGPLPAWEHGEVPLEIFDRGLQIHIWREQDVVMVAAAAASNQQRL